MLLALTAGQKLGLALVAGLFIAFALGSSFLLPRRNPDFPGRRVNLFAAVSVLFAVAMVGAMFVLAVEAPEEVHPEEAVETVGEDAETTPPPADGMEGDPAAGEQVFAEGGCAGCHTLEAAGATGTVAPNLDEARPSFEEAVEVITNGRGGMPSFRDRFEAEQIRDVARYVVESTQD